MRPASPRAFAKCWVSAWFWGEEERPNLSKDSRKPSESSFWTPCISAQYSATGWPALAAASSAGVPCSSVAQRNSTSWPRARM
jgi:hypothetical protein